ncbi:hypothetical protein DP939_01975 [Spongiactinospora rosea]|uniref:Uncharacterized protein n=1 Tax=Spongiactinospora rosea TaxID=2248750 RepID=A0A366M5M2_9ACTN|nr:hypothetical protein [Spongiactinospora rosea]RBQ21501.1 hypothetical protein DP939_01975 [Spongiactinospora rosea]
MRRRLGIAAALLSDPGGLILDKPINGHDPESIRWTRGLLRTPADEGRISSQTMSATALTADQGVIIGRGRLTIEATVDELDARVHPGVPARSPREDELKRQLLAHGVVVRLEPGVAPAISCGRRGTTRTPEPDRVWHSRRPPRAASRCMRSRSAPLEEPFIEGTADSTHHRAGQRQA